MRGRVADQLVETGHVLFVQPWQRAVIGYSKEDRAAFRIGEGCHLRCQGIGIGDVLLELAAAIFSEIYTGFEFL